MIDEVEGWRRVRICRCVGAVELVRTARRCVMQEQREGCRGKETRTYRCSARTDPVIR